MKMLSKLTLKYLKKNPIRTFITIFGLSISIAMIVVVLTTIASYRETMLASQLQDSGYEDFTINGANDELFKDVITTSNVASLRKTRNYRNIIEYISIPESYDRVININIKDVEEGYFKDIFKNKMVEGRLPEKAGEAIVPYDVKGIIPLLSTLNSKVQVPTVRSDDLSVFRDYMLFDESVKPAEIDEIFASIHRDGIGEYVKNNFLTDEEGYGKADFTIVGYYSGQSFSYASKQDASLRERFKLDYNYLESNLIILSDIKSKTYDADGLIYDYSKTDSTLKELFNKVDKAGPESVLYANDFAINLKYPQRDEEGNSKFNMLYFVIILIIIAFTIFILNIFITNYVEKIRDMGLLKVVGLTNMQLLKMVFVEAVIFLLISFPLGYLLGELLMRSMADYIRFILNDNLPGIYTNFVYKSTLNIFFITLALSALMIFVAEFLASRYVLKSSPMKSMILRISRSKSRYDKRKFRLSRKLFGYEGFISIRNISRNKFRFFMNTASIGLSIVIFVIIAYMTNSLMQRSIHTLDGESASYGVVVSEDSKKTREFIHEIEKIENVVAENSTSYTEISVRTDKKNFDQNSNLLILFNDTVFEKTFKEYANVSNVALVASSNKDIKTSNDKVYFANYSDEKSKSAAFVTRTIDTEEPKVVKFIKSLDNYDNVFIIRNSDRGVLSNTTKDSVKDMVELSKKSDSPMILEQVKALLIKYPSIKIQGFNIPLIKIMNIFAFSFILQIALIGILNIINSTYGSLAIRSREIALLKAVGIEESRLRQIVMYESVFSVLFAAIHSLWVTYLGTYLVYKMQETDLAIFDIKYAYPIKYYVIGVVVSFILVYLFSYLPYKDVNKEHTTGILKYE